MDFGEAKASNHKMDVFQFFVHLMPVCKPGSFLDRLKKTQGSRKLKPQENNSKLKQKTQGFGEILKDNYKF